MDTAIEAGYKDMKHVCFIKSYLETGADIGCEKEGRLPTFGRIDISVSDNGFEVADKIVSWLKMGIYVGPLSDSELPFTDYSVSPLKTRIKPNGRVRLILDLSYPHNKDVELGMGIPCSVNKVISKDRFKTQMSSTPLWLNTLRHGGIGAPMSKLDW